MATNPMRDTPGPPGNKNRAPDGPGFLSQAASKGSAAVSATGSAIKSGVVNTVEDLFDFSDLPQDGFKVKTRADFSDQLANPDWRVKLSIPEQFKSSYLLKLLTQQGGFIFPYTPTIIISHSANYNSLQPVHTNYPFQIYNNSQAQEIVITGDFTVENAADSLYWVGCIHYLRSVTKMFYGGDDKDAGSPPPLVRLNGYGDYVFNDVPCVVTNFTVDLPADVDYIACTLKEAVESSDNPELQKLGVDTSSADETTWVPTQSLITVTLQPTYSRKKVSKFNLNDFVNGNTINTGRGFI